MHKLNTIKQPYGEARPRCLVTSSKTALTAKREPEMQSPAQHVNDNVRAISVYLDSAMGTGC